ncbi:hypothetical protein LIA77_01756 [Sarocladium implicatum]|nr:hypothetical protein LIA77_01756 [Sarocladium implicatum]
MPSNYRSGSEDGLSVAHKCQWHGPRYQINEITRQMHSMQGTYPTPRSHSGVWAPQEIKDLRVRLTARQCSLLALHVNLLYWVLLVSWF